MERNKRPGNHLGIAVFAHHESSERMMFQIRLLGNSTDEAGRIKAGTGTKYAVARQSAQFLYQVGNDIAGVRNIDKNAVEPASHDFIHKAGYFLDRIFHFTVAIQRCQ